MRIDLSGSPDTPYDNVGAAHAGIDTVYVWAGMWALAEVDFGIGGTYDILGVVSSPGVLNLGTQTSLHFVPDPGWLGVLPTGFLAMVVVEDSAGSGASLCLGLSEETGRLCMKVSWDTEWYQPDTYSGFTTVPGRAQCIVGSPPCGLLAVEQESWGRMKALYR